MQQTKYFIEGMTAAHSGSGRYCRYKRAENICEWLAGFDSVDRSHMMIRFTVNEAGQVSDLQQPDPCYVGTLRQCQDRAVTLQRNDPKGAAYVVYNQNGKPYQYKGIGDQ